MPALSIRYSGPSIENIPRSLRLPSRNCRCMTQQQCFFLADRRVVWRVGCRTLGIATAVQVLLTLLFSLPSKRYLTFLCRYAPCGLRGCKNGPAPFPGRMSYKATKPGLVFVLYLSMFFIVLMFIRALFMYC